MHQTVTVTIAFRADVAISPELIADASVTALMQAFANEPRVLVIPALTEVATS